MLGRALAEAEAPQDFELAMAWNILQPFSHRWSRCIINHNNLFKHLRTKRYEKCSQTREMAKHL